MKFLIFMFIFFLTQTQVYGESTNRREKLIKACKDISSDDAFGYSCSILEMHGHYVFILGETHVKGFWEKKQGLKFVKKFSLIGIEGMPPEECDEENENDPDRKVLSFFDFSKKQDFTKLLDNFLFAAVFGITHSTLYDVFSDQTQIVNLDFAEKSKDTLKHYHSSNSSMVIGLELGAKFSHPVQWYVDRDKRMADNIDTVLSSHFSEPVNMLVVVGAFHVPGIVHVLRHDYKYELVFRKKDLRKEENEKRDLVMTGIASWLVKNTVTAFAIHLAARQYDRTVGYTKLFFLTRFIQESTDWIYRMCTRESVE